MESTTSPPTSDAETKESVILTNTNSLLSARMSDQGSSGLDVCFSV